MNSPGGLVQSLAAKDGKVRWEAIVDAGGCEPLWMESVGDSVVIARTQSVESHEASSGNLQWRRDGLNQVNGLGLSPDSSIVVSTYHGDVMELAPADGHEQANRSLGKGTNRDTLVSTPAGNAIASGAEIHLLDHQGVERWRYQSDHVNNDLISDGRLIYVSSDQGAVTALQPEDGKAVWRAQAGDCPCGPPAIDGRGHLLISALNEDQSELRALDGKGYTAWVQPFGLRCRADPADADTIVVHDHRDDDQLVLLRSSDGKVLDRIQVEDLKEFSAGSDGTVYAVTWEGQVEAFATR